MVRSPKEEDGRSYEIHHIDGNHGNNAIANLTCIPIKEHYDEHYRNGDWGACVLIARRMGLPPDYLSSIQRGKKRPGIGGVKKGTVPWNKGKTGWRPNISPEGKIRQMAAVKNRAKIKDSDKKLLREQYMSRVGADDPLIGTVRKNGRVMTYKWAFCIQQAARFNVTGTHIRKILDV